MTDLDIREGVTWPGYTWALTDPDSGDPLDLTGYTARGQIRPTPESPLLHWTWDSGGDGDALVVIAGNVIGIALTDGQAALFTWSTPSGWDLRATGPQGSLIIDGGRVNITRTHTRET